MTYLRAILVTGLLASLIGLASEDRVRVGAEKLPPPPTPAEPPIRVAVEVDPVQVAAQPPEKSVVRRWRPEIDPAAIDQLVKEAEVQPQTFAVYSAGLDAIIESGQVGLLLLYDQQSAGRIKQVTDAIAGLPVIAILANVDEEIEGEDTRLDWTGQGFSVPGVYRFNHTRQAWYPESDKGLRARMLKHHKEPEDE